MVFLYFLCCSSPSFLFFFCFPHLIYGSFIVDGHDEIDIQYSWFERGCNASCSEVFIYERNMANFEIVEAVKTSEQTIYHTSKNFAQIYRPIFTGHRGNSSEI